MDASRLMHPGNLIHTNIDIIYYSHAESFIFSQNPLRMPKFYPILHIPVHPFQARSSLSLTASRASKTPLSRTKFSFHDSRASKAPFHARRSLSTSPVRQKPTFTHAADFYCAETRLNGRGTVRYRMNAYADSTVGSLYAARLLRDTAAGGSPKALLAVPDACREAECIRSSEAGVCLSRQPEYIFQAWGVTSSSASRAPEASFHARSSLSTLPVRQKPTFTHGVLFQRFPCVRSPFSRTEFSFNASRASEHHFHARSSLSTPPVRQKPTFTHAAAFCCVETCLNGRARSDIE